MGFFETQKSSKALNDLRVICARGFRPITLEDFDSIENDYDHYGPVNHPFFDVTDVDGRFDLPLVPAGTYTLVGWYEGEARVTRPVVVPATGWAEVDMVVP